MRIAALDVGEKRVGIAISDAFGWTAQGLETYQRTEESKDCGYIAELLMDKGAERVVVGLPRNMDGSLGPQADYVMAFVKALSAYTDVPVVFWDERLSTAAARRTLLEADVSREKRRKVIDKMAAVHILQGYLDRKNNE